MATSSTINNDMMFGGNNDKVIVDFDPVYTDQEIRRAQDLFERQQRDEKQREADDYNRRIDKIKREYRERNRGNDMFTSRVHRMHETGAVVRDPTRASKILGLDSSVTGNTFVIGSDPIQEGSSASFGVYKKRHGLEFRTSSSKPSKISKDYKKEFNVLVKKFLKGSLTVLKKMGVVAVNALKGLINIVNK